MYFRFQCIPLILIGIISLIFAEKITDFILSLSPEHKFNKQPYKSLLYVWPIRFIGVICLGFSFFIFFSGPSTLYMNKDKNRIALLDNGEIIKESLTSLAEGLTGIAASERKDLALSVGHLFQAFRKGQFLSLLSEEWNSYREKGRIKDNYIDTEQHRVCLQELLEFLEKDCPDEIRFDTMKKIFLVAATETVSDRNSLLPYQFLSICRRMSSGEVIVLNTTYRMAKSGQKPNWNAARKWLEVIAKESGFDHTSLVEIYEAELIKKYLLTSRRFTDGSGIVLGDHFRLTSLGFELCNFISSYDNWEGQN